MKQSQSFFVGVAHSLSKCLFVQEHFSLGTSRLEKSSAKLKYTFRIRNCVEVEFSK